jgi:hypothetical protein
MVTAARAAFHLARREGRWVTQLALHAELMDALFQQLVDDLSFYQNEGLDMGIARVLVLPEFTNLTTLAIAGRVEALEPAMYEAMCGRVAAQHAGWRAPRIDYIVEEDGVAGAGGGGGVPAGKAGGWVPLVVDAPPPRGGVITTEGADEVDAKMDAKMVSEGEGNGDVEMTACQGEVEEGV